MAALATATAIGVHIPTIHLSLDIEGNAGQEGTQDRGNAGQTEVTLMQPYLIVLLRHTLRQSWFVLSGWEQLVGQFFDGARLHHRATLGGMAKMAGCLVRLEAGAHDAA